MPPHPAGRKGVIRAVSLSAIILLLAAVSTTLTGGRPVLLALPALGFALAVILAPLLGLVLTVVTHVIWLLGSFAPGGIGLLALSKVFTGLTFLAWLQRAIRDREALTYAPHMKALGFFIAVVLLGPMLTPAFTDAFVGIGKYAMMVAPYFLVANLAVTKRGVVVSAAAISGAATLAALLALAERLLPGLSLEFGEGVRLGAHVDATSLDAGVAIKRVTGGIGDANWFSYTMATAIPLALYWWRAYPVLWVRVAALGMGAVQLLGIVLSYTRTPLLGLIAAVAFLVWKRRLPLVQVAVATVLIGASSPLWLPEGFVDRFFSAKYLREGSTPMRREIFEMAATLIVIKPLVGHGYQQYGPQFIAHSKTEMGLEWERRDLDGSEPAHLLRAHNLYLDVWVMHGLLGLVPLVMMYLLLLRELNQVARCGTPRQAELAVAMMACLLAFYVCGIGGHAQELKIFWVLAGLAAGLRRVAFGGAPARP